MLTHHLRPSFTLVDTTFHFVNGTLSEVLEQARAAAEGRDVRLGGGAQTIRAFLDADLVDTRHVAVAPLEPGTGTRLWASSDELDDRYHHDIVPSPKRSGPPPALETLTYRPVRESPLISLVSRGSLTGQLSKWLRPIFWSTV